MKLFDRSSPIGLLPFLKDLSITLNAQRLNEGVAVRVVAHFLESEAERLYTSFTMSAIRSGALRTSASTTWPTLVQTFIQWYLTDDVLIRAYEKFTTICQLPYENENVCADRLEAEAYACTAVFSEATLMNYYERVLSAETRDVVASAVQRLDAKKRTDLSMIRWIALAEGNTHRARSGKTLPDIGIHAQ